MRIALVVLAALGLAACEDQDTKRARNETYLPNGCKIIDLDYYDLRAAVICKGLTTTSTARGWNETQTQIQSDGRGGTYTTTSTVHHSHIGAVIGEPE